MPEIHDDLFEDRGGKLLPLILWVVPAEDALPLAVEGLEHLCLYLQRHDYTVATIPENWQLKEKSAIHQQILGGLPPADLTIEGYLHQLLLYETYIRYHQVHERILLGVGGWVRGLYSLAQKIDGGLEYLQGLLQLTAVEEIPGEFVWLRLLFEYTTLHSLVTPTYYYLLPGERDYSQDFRLYIDNLKVFWQSRGRCMIHECEFPAPEEMYWDMLNHWPRVPEKFTYEIHKKGD